MKKKLQKLARQLAAQGPDAAVTGAIGDVTKYTAIEFACLIAYILHEFQVQGDDMSRARFYKALAAHLNG